jgi:hypothetical protein
MFEEVARTESGPLERFRAGEIDLEAYLDLKVQAAMSHLEGLTPGQRDDARAILRAEIATEPALRELLLRATRREP